MTPTWPSNPVESLGHHRAATVNEYKNILFISFRQNPAFQPDALHAWDIQSPTMGNQQRSPWNFPENSSPNLNDVVNPTKLPPRVAKPVATPVAPLPIPQPDYSPPLGRPVRHEPNLYEIPGRSVLKKPNPTGRTVF